MAISQKRRIWGWMFFDWAQQPFYTLGLTFVFGPYFAYVATELFVSQGEALSEAKAHSQWLWSLGQTISGVIIALSAPLLGAIAARYLGSSSSRWPMSWHRRSCGGSHRTVQI